MKRCPDCGKEYDDSAKFCFECGGKLEPVVVKLTCPQCGTEYKEGTKFCMECGFKLIGVNAPKSSVSLGDANAISGGVDASSNSHNTTTVNKSNVVTETHTTANTNTSTSNSNNTTTNVFNIQGGMSGAIGGFNLGGGRAVDAPEMYEVTFSANGPCIIFDRFQEIARIVEGDEYGRFHISLPMKKGMHRFEFVCIEDKKVKKELIKAIKSDEDTIIDIQLDLPIGLPAPEIPAQTALPEATEEVVAESPTQPTADSDSDNEFDDTETTARPNDEQTKSITFIGEWINGEFTAAYSKSGNKFFGFMESSSLIEYSVIPGTNVICDESFKDTLLETVYLPASIQLVSKSAFENCHNLKNIVVPEGTLQDFKEIIDRKFWPLIKCGQFPEQESDLHVTFTEESDFDHIFIYVTAFHPQLMLSNSCQRLLQLHPDFNAKEVTLPPFVMVLCDGTFNRCDSIERVVLPPTIEKIGDGVFEFCPNLKEIVIPSGMKEHFQDMMDQSVAHLIKEEDVYSEVVADIAPNPLIASDFQVGEHINGEYIADYSNDGKQLIAVNENAKWLTEYHVLNGTEVICTRAFKYCAVETVFLPRSLQMVGEAIFEYCSNLKEICIPKGQAAKFTELLPEYVDLMVEVPILPQRPNMHADMEDEEQQHFMYDPRNELMYSPDLTRLLGNGNAKLDYLTLLNSTKVICNGALNNSVATTISIPESVEVVGKDAFTGSKIDCICSNTFNEPHLQHLFEGSKCAKFINNFGTDDEEEVPTKNGEEGIFYSLNDNSQVFYNRNGGVFLGLSDGYDLSELTIPEGTDEFGDSSQLPEECDVWNSVTTIVLPKSIKAYNWNAPLKKYFPNLQEIRIPKGTKTTFAKVLMDEDENLLSLPGTNKKSTTKAKAKDEAPQTPPALDKTDANSDVVKYTITKNGKVFNGLTGKYKGDTFVLDPDTVGVKLANNWLSFEHLKEGEEIKVVVLPSISKGKYSARTGIYDNAYNLGEFLNSLENLSLIKVPEGMASSFYQMLPFFWHLIDDGKTPMPWVKAIKKGEQYQFFNYGANILDSKCTSDCYSYGCMLIPSTVHTIEKNAFAKCNYRCVYICEGLKTIKNGAFKNCGNLEEIYLPKSLTTVETGGFLSSKPFEGCSRLKKIIVPKRTKAKFQKLLSPIGLSHLIVEDK